MEQKPITNNINLDKYIIKEFPIKNNSEKYINEIEYKFEKIYNDINKFGSGLVNTLNPKPQPKLNSELLHWFGRFNAGPRDPKFVSKQEDCSGFTWINAGVMDQRASDFWKTAVDMMNWCVEHCSGRWSRTTSHLSFGFENDDDAMIFRLRWC